MSILNFQNSIIRTQNARRSNCYRMMSASVTIARRLASYLP